MGLAPHTQKHGKKVFLKLISSLPGWIKADLFMFEAVNSWLRNVDFTREKCALNFGVFSCAF